MMVVGVAGKAPLGSSAAAVVDLGNGLNRLLLTTIGVVFFIVKFGGFSLLIGLFVVLLPAFLGSGDGSGARAMHEALKPSGSGVTLAMAALFVSHGVSFVRNFLMGREYDRTNVLGLVFWPYARMSLVAGILLGGIAVARVVPGLAAETMSSW
jgi:Family of unknown function (DUF6498)